MPKTHIPEQQDTTLIVREVITIGSDPEFAIVSPTGDRTYNADEVFKPKDPHSPTCDFGYDGHSATGEIRPKPAKSPKEAVQIIKKLLETNKKKYPQAYKFNLMSTSHRLSLGGHIHFGNMKFLGSDRRYSNGLSEVGNTLVHNLDNLLAFPSMFLENRDDAQFRRGTSYGGFSDARPQAWGFEYRTLSSFIASKQLTSGIFYLAYALADATLNFGYKCKNLVKTIGFDNAFRCQYRELLKPHLKYVLKEHEKLPLYKEQKDYKKNIDIFDEMVVKEEPEFNKEIKAGWNISFDITDFWKVEKLETLLEKITKLLVAIHTLKRKIFKPITHKFVAGSYKDVGCPEIAHRVNLALNNLIDKEVLKSQQWHTLRIYGLKENRGNEIWLGNMFLKEKREKQILAYLWEIASEFSHKTKIGDISYNKKEMYGHDFQIAFGRKVREENLLLAETMVVIVLLLINRDLFKQTQRVKGKTRKLLVTKSKVVNTIIKNLKKTKKFKAIIPLNITPKLNDIELPLLFDLKKSYSEILEEIRGIDNDGKYEVAQACVDRLKNGKLSPILETGCINKCENKYDLYNVKLVKLCPTHIAKAVKKVVTALPSVTNRGWDFFFTPSKQVTCNSCSNTYPMSVICEYCGECTPNCCSCHQCSACERRVNEDDYCSTCERCSECCEYCELCEEHYADDCTCSTCEECDDRFREDNFCDDCNRCNNHCTCNDEDNENDEPYQAPDLTTPGTTSASTEPVNPINSILDPNIMATGTPGGGAERRTG